jgi:hypothetical protein
LSMEPSLLFLFHYLRWGILMPNAVVKVRLGST